MTCIKALSMATAIAASLTANQALAHQAGDIFVRAGLATVAPDESSDGVAIPALDIAPIAGTEAQVDDNTQPGLTITYMLSNKLGIELLASTPFTHDISANLNGYSPGLKVDAAEAKHLPPTLSAVYYPFADSGSAFQPYAGLGLNYTIFFEEDVDSDLEALTGTLAGASGPVPMKLKLDNSLGLALQLGADYSLDKNWHLNASVRWIDINTDATFNSALGKTITVDDVEIDPWVYQVNIGYKFR
ncbi:outer membrane beta-barrel protein [Pseudomaricurvus alcaniphilus]|uniref:OmpW/AlkL family protein n=1 Tax=Pseudomaricurvus alcaniphilus TaxID=1166482 RepID=UPI00140CA688|nr:OmpW family outer membrane protein [Pseudomaricurvus alcaniphilus]NHN39602.1 outer membrane beta-barrel protein [Pseudomaricurvus alcaniphilus]